MLSSNADVMAAEFPVNLRPIAQALLADFQSVGLFPEMAQHEFEVLLLAPANHLILEEWEEIWEEVREDEENAMYFRHDVLARLRGIWQNVGFAAEDVLYQVVRQIKGDEAKLTWDQERYVDRERAEREIRLNLNGKESVWRYRSPAGLVEGVNRLLELAGMKTKFIGLVSSGDYYCYVYGTEAIEGRLKRSPLFRVSAEENDPMARPVL